MKELSIPFSEKITSFRKGSNWNEFRVFSPTGLVPCLVDGDQIIWDSLGITEYLAEKYNQVWPKEIRARAWARCASAEMHSGFSNLREQCSMNCSVIVELNGISDALQKDISRLDELWSQGINTFNGPYLAGSRFTAVDAFYAPVAIRVRNYGIQMSKVSLDYVNLILSIDSVRAWEISAQNESWREPEHEEDCSKFGVIIQDFRRA